MKDLFSQHAAHYAAFRPMYPAALFDYMLNHVQHRQRAWDCATGNGQAARSLAPYFDAVVATDISEKQLAEAPAMPGITYRIAAAEHSGLENESVDLITVAQALHWFDRPAFYQEVRRVLRPSGVLAVWGYGLLTINPAADAIIHTFYRDVVGAYWDAARRWVDDHYTSLEFPFAEISTPPFTLTVSWTTAQLQGYLESWSATQAFIRQHQANPVKVLMADLQHHLPTEKIFDVSFPLFLRLGRIS